MMYIMMLIIGVMSMSPIKTIDGGRSSRSLLVPIERVSSFASRLAALEKPRNYPTGGLIRGGGIPIGVPEIPIIASVSPEENWNGTRWVLSATIITSYDPPQDYRGLEAQIDDGEGFFVTVNRYGPYTPTWNVGDLGFQFGHTYAVRIRALLGRGATQYTQWFTGLYFNPDPNIPTAPVISRDVTFNGGIGWDWDASGVKWGLLWDYSGPLPVDEWRVWWTADDHPEGDGQFSLWSNWPGPPYGVVMEGFHRGWTYRVHMSVRRGSFVSEDSNELVVMPVGQTLLPPTSLSNADYYYSGSTGGTDINIVPPVVHPHHYMYEWNRTDAGMNPIYPLPYVTLYSISDLEVGIPYITRVWSASEWGDVSATFASLVFTVPVEDPPAPTDPVVAGIAYGETVSLDLSFTLPDPLPAGYAIDIEWDYNVGGPATNPWYSVEGLPTRVTFPGLNRSNAYVFRVRGRTPRGAVSSVPMEFTYIIPREYPLPPTISTDFTPMGMEANGLTAFAELHWTHSTSPNVAHYVYQLEVNGNRLDPVIMAGDETSAYLSGLPFDTPLAVRMQSFTFWWDSGDLTDWVPFSIPYVINPGLFPYNGDFENRLPSAPAGALPDGWIDAQDPLGSVDIDLDITSGNFRTGHTSLKLSAPDQTIPSERVLGSRRFPVLAGTEWSLHASGKMDGTVVDAPLFVLIQCFDAGGLPIGLAPVSLSFHSTTWEDKSGSAAMPAGTASARVIVAFNNSGATTSIQGWIDSIYIVASTTGTDLASKAVSMVHLSFAQSTAPSSHADGDLWWDKTNHIWYYWDSDVGLWLSDKYVPIALHKRQFAEWYSTDGPEAYAGTWPSLPIWIEKVDFGGFCGSMDGSNYWQFNVWGIAAGNSVSVLGSIQNQTIWSPSAWSVGSLLYSSLAGNPYAASAFKDMEIVLGKIGSPSDLLVFPTVYARLWHS
jgi:hypothetical protein